MRKRKAGPSETTPRCSGALKHPRSISAQLFFYYALCLIIIIGVSGFAMYEIGELRLITNDVASHQLSETRVLGKLADHLQDLRMDQARLGLASDENTIEKAEASAARHLVALRRAETEYLALPREDEEQTQLHLLQITLRSFVFDHDAYLALPHESRRAKSSAFQRRAQALFTRAESAIDAMIAWNEKEAERAISIADHVANRAVRIFTMVLVFVALMAALVFTIVRDRISRPLASITNALTALAAGNRNVVLPESNRCDEIGQMSRAFEVFRANAYALQAAHEEAEAARLQAQSLARHDILTGLPNRRVLVEELEKALYRVDHGGPPFSVLLIDLDRFKPVNDIHGHPAGDMVLCEISERLKGVLGGSDTLARIGGDEFAMVVETAGTNVPSDALIRLAQRVQEVVCAPISVGDMTVEVGASIGIALCPADGHGADVILRAADIAMCRAKEAGRGTFRFYEQSMDTELRARAALEADIRHAVSVGEIVPYYQPLIDLRSGRLLGFEILARWRSPGNEMVPPSTFIPIIERLGLMSEFTCCLLRQACHDAKLWPSELTLSLNISPIELTDPLFPIRLLSVLSESGFPPQRLEIEITENALVTDLVTAKSILASLQSAGIKISLDDFGTGYSSLYHLRELDLDRIKIDQSFIQSINRDPESLKLVNVILGLAKSLDLPTTAEGIEDADVLERTVKAGVDTGQGYYFSRALPAAEATAWIRNEALFERKIA